MHHTQQLLPSVWVPDRWTDLPFPGFNGWQHIGCSWCVNECQGECFMDVDGICPVQSDSLEHKPAPLPSLADLGIILIFNLKVSGILGGICLLPDLFITTWSFRSVEVASRLPGFKVGGKKQILFQGSLNVLKQHVETSCRDSWNIYHVWQKYLLTKMCHGKSTVFLIVTSCTFFFWLSGASSWGYNTFTNFAVSPRKGFGMVLECSGGNGTEILVRPALRKGWEGHSGC